MIVTTRTFKVIHPSKDAPTGEILRDNQSIVDVMYIIVRFIIPIIYSCPKRSTRAVF